MVDVVADRLPATGERVHGSVRLRAGGSAVDAALARDDELPTGIAVALEEAVVASRGANARLSVADLPSPFQGDALLVSGFALFQDGSREAAHAALDRFEGAWTAVDLASPRLASLDFEARVVFATTEEARAVPGLEDEFEIVCRKEGYAVDRTVAFGAGDAFAAAFLVALADGAKVDAALESARAAAARVATGALL